MVCHVVLFNPRLDLSPDDRRAVVVAFERAVRDVPTVRGVRTGRRLVHGAGYEQRMPATFEYLVVLDFDDLAGLEAYLRHPAHEELGARFNASFSSALIYDFEMAGLQELAEEDGR